MKRCTFCKEVKPLEEFTFYAKGKSGVCKQCKDEGFLYQNKKKLKNLSYFEYLEECRQEFDFEEEYSNEPTQYDRLEDFSLFDDPEDL